jgi:hypothetical protein
MTAKQLETHIDDSLRVGVLAALEEAKLRFVSHLMACQRCEERLLELIEEVSALEKADDAAETSCEQTRVVVLQLLDFAKRPAPEHLAHLQRCEDCYDLFVDPAKSLRVLEADETGEVG